MAGSATSSAAAATSSGSRLVLANLFSHDVVAEVKHRTCPDADPWLGNLPSRAALAAVGEPGAAPQPPDRPGDVRGSLMADRYPRKPSSTASAPV